MVRRSVSLGALAGLLVPVVALAAMTRPSEVLRSLNWAYVPSTYSVEVHAGSDGTFLSAWAKGRHEGTAPATMKGDGVLTVDMANPAEGMSVRFRTEFRYLDGMVYLKPSLEGTMQDELIVLNGGMEAKQWGYIEMPEDAYTEVAEGGSIEHIGEMLRMHGITITDRELEAAIADLVDNMFVMELRGGEYSISFKQNAADEIMAHMMLFLGRISGDPETLGDFAPSSSEMAAMRELLNSINMHIRVRLDAQSKPTFLKMYMAGETPDGWASMQGTAEKLWSPLTVTVPAGSVQLEDMFGLFDHMGGLFDASDLMMFNMPSDDLWMDELPGAMEDEAVWDDVENQDWYDYTNDEMIPEDNCTADSVESLQMLRKGLTCDRQVRSRRHLQR